MLAAGCRHFFRKALWLVWLVFLVDCGYGLAAGVRRLLPFSGVSSWCVVFSACFFFLRFSRLLTVALSLLRLACLNYHGSALCWRGFGFLDDSLSVLGVTLSP